MADFPGPSELASLTTEQLRERGSLKWTKFGPETIGAFVAEMDFGTAPAVLTALHEAVARGEFGYLPPALAADLAAACADFQHTRYGWRVEPELVFPVSDVLTGFELVMRHFSPPDTPIILPTPAYMPFLTLPPLHGRQVLQTPMRCEAGHYTLDLDRLAAAFRAGGRLLVLCNPANPVGRVFTPDELAAVTELVDRFGGRVFADEVHAPLTYAGHRHTPYAMTSAAAAAHTITAVSTSKAWNLPGLRCAQIILSNPADRAAWSVVGTGASTAPATIGVPAATAAYRAGRSWLDGAIDYLDQNRQLLAQLFADQLPQLAYHPPEGTYLAWLDCRRLPAADAPGEFFAQHAAVALVDGAECGEAGRGWVRMNIATPAPILHEMVTRLARAVGEDAVT
ncbi:aminotransferase class I/II-fold pyridoxal phosphate-dependent enzyme [Natronosporangium hydrolyticum]|uniref:cysteine-S-conjugate beta-lyase n=1 Tax=Natronosporangium hydrolyticum TaxID=2811111 RepID=A0A895YI71_9ACTN|nr:aminotransferase class I/II-fold pyridoxal phosphate-dependent enzyme [Natronosporangium hydrolyticum]QSB15752.1 aminotransferase class I/II-fold pyridoxal phosphate-dependent enzyme [Natronosporangium hydrolyticum]